LSWISRTNPSHICDQVLGNAFHTEYETFIAQWLCFL
jgi:hypothetical protein